MGSPFSIQVRMAAQGYILFLFGLSMVIALGVIIAVYYTRKDKDDVEKPKYHMMDDD